MHIYLQNKNRFENDINLYVIPKAGEIAPNSIKPAVKYSREILLKMRIAKKMQEIYESIANDDGESQIKTSHDLNQNEINRKKEYK